MSDNASHNKKQMQINTILLEEDSETSFAVPSRGEEAGRSPIEMSSPGLGSSYNRLKYYSALRTGY